MNTPSADSQTSSFPLAPEEVFISSILSEIRRVVAWFTQIFSWFVAGSLYFVLFKLKVQNREKLKNLKGPIIIVTNHIEWHDPFLIRQVLGLKTRLLPLRYMATKFFYNQFTQFLYNIGLIPLFYLFAGAFTIEQGRGINNNLIKAKNILRKGGSVVIFPEGRMNKEGSDGKFLPFKKGAAVLAMDENVNVLPMFIKRHNNGWRDDLTVVIGDVFKLSKQAAEDGANMLRNTLISLTK